MYVPVIVQSTYTLRLQNSKMFVLRLRFSRTRLTGSWLLLMHLVSTVRSRSKVNLYHASAAKSLLPQCFCPLAFSAFSKSYATYLCLFAFAATYTLQRALCACRQQMGPNPQRLQKLAPLMP